MHTLKTVLLGSSVLVLEADISQYRIYTHSPGYNETQLLLGAAFCYSGVNGSKRCIEKYLLLEPKRSYPAERSSMCAFNLQSKTDVRLQEFVKPFFEAA